MQKMSKKTLNISCDVRQFHSLITCNICQGYMIDPTTVDYCYHTYCRSCILKHLLRDAYCPECKSTGGKQISEDNLRPDNTKRSLIYKLVPGLYQRECNQLAEFEEQQKELSNEEEDDAEEDEKPQQEFFTVAEPISLSLEYHPAMLQQCGAGKGPAIIYLQCPAGLKVQHLKRFLSSKYDIDLENKQIDLEITYEDEVLPINFTLMDVGYCYKWNRLAPMAFHYRILLYDEMERINCQEKNLSKVKQDIELGQGHEQASSCVVGGVGRWKTGKSVTFADDLELDIESQASQRSSKARGKVSNVSKTTTMRRVAATPAKREPEEPSPVSSFKSLRSNDMRYSDYPVARVKSEPVLVGDEASSTTTTTTNLVSHANIVVSIPPSQLSKSSGYGDEGVFELKTANKKSSHLPKLKIELNSMKSKLSMPKSAGARLEETSSAQQLDLETYAKNIGLKPIEPAATTPIVADTKFSPNASPMSSCSSSTNGSSSNGLNEVAISSSSSSHRKRKKKHSKEPKDANGKRKKLHAEISSQTDGKMKMKITTTPKAHKVDLKRSHSLAGGELASVSLTHLKLDEKSRESSDVLNRTLGEEARSISDLITPTSLGGTNESLAKVNTKELTLPASPPLPPSLFKAFTPNTTATATSLSSPAATTTTMANVSKTTATTAPVPVSVSVPVAAASLSVPMKPKQQQQQALSQNNRSKPHFVVPQAPPPPTRPMPHTMQRYLSTPSSIASAANKPAAKRSISIDETHPGKQQRFHHHLHHPHPHQGPTQAAMAAKWQLNHGPKMSHQPQQQMRLYGPEMAKSSMPLLCPNLSLTSLPNQAISITPRPRSTTTTATTTTSQGTGNINNNNNNNLLSYHPTAMDHHMPALEIVRLGPNKPKLTMPPLSPPSSRLMGPPIGLPAKPGQLKMPIPTVSKSPPLSVVLSGQRSQAVASSSSSAYRTSPPALNFLNNIVPLPFSSKSSSGVNSKKSPTATGQQTSKTNGTSDKFKTSLREFRPPPPTTTTTAATTTSSQATATAKDADILDLSAKQSQVQSKAPTSSQPLVSNSLEVALNKIKQNISANSPTSSSSTTTASTAAASSNSNSKSSASASSSSSSSGDDLQNLHMLSESATAREKISIKFENNKPKNANANAVVRPQNASVRSIPNPSALAFRNQPAITAAAAATATPVTVSMTVKTDEKLSKLTTPTSSSQPITPNTIQVSPTNSNSSQVTGSSAAATSPRALTKKPTTIDQVAANLNIRAEAKAAALAEESPAPAKSPEVAKTTPPPAAAAAAVSKSTELKEATTTTVTVTAASTLLTMPTNMVSSSNVPSAPSASVQLSQEAAMSKPPVQISATDTLAPVASSA
ncbi:protein suppressor 2 of zeste [Drosophila tropicalis]|uniref:protein suppressor 2 of zeste n=1 Tax=Drosophila tropicalis TaxID=46794 RepID=UPI0035ABFCD0